MAYYLIEGLLYRRKDSVIHRRDPRVRLAMSLAIIALALAASDLGDALAASIAIAVPIALARVARRAARLMIVTAPFSALVFLGGFLLGQGLIYSAVLAMRFLNVFLASSFFFLTTSPDELEQVMRWMKLPRDFVFAFTTAVRFVPVLMLDLKGIVDSQMSRGLQLQTRNPYRWIRNMTPVLIPLLVNSLARSEQLAEAMESRGYRASPSPSSSYRLRMGGMDAAFLSIYLAAAVILFHLLA